MLYLFEFVVYLIFMIFKLYDFLDSIFLFSYQGSKLNNYLKINNLNNNIIKKSNNKIKLNYNILFISIMISINLFLVKLLFSQKILYSNFIYIKGFSKGFDVVSKFSKFFYLFKYIYFLLFFIFYTYIIYYILNLRQNKQLIQYNNDYLRNDYIVGTDDYNKNVYLPKSGMFQNILIVGSIGSGKTSSCINNILNYLVKENLNGLVIDVKGNYYNTLLRICKIHNKESKLIKISLDNDFKYNPLINNNLSEIEIASNLRKILELLSTNNKSDSYFLDKAEGYIKDFIVLIKVYNNFNVNFSEIHKLAVNNDYLKEKINYVIEKCLNNNLLNDEKMFNIKNSIYNLKNEYLKLDDRNLNLIKSEISRITDVFVSDYIIYKKFCGISENIDFSKDKIYLLSLDISKNKKLSKIISTYLKLDFQNQVLNNNNKEMFFVCDEYQEIANKEDAHFFSLSREYKCINIVSMQSYSSLYNSLNDKDSANVIIQNFVNKIWLRNDDVETVDRIIKQIGKEDKEKCTLNLTENSKESKYNFLSKKFKNNKSSLNEGYSFNKVNEYILDFNYFTTKLKTFESVCFISDGINMNLHKKVIMKRLDLNHLDRR